MDAEKISVDGFNLNISDAKARNMISDKYDPDNGTYVVGDTCINDDILYICNTDIDTPEAFDPTKWDADTVGHYCSELKSNLTNLETYSTDEIVIGDFLGKPLYRKVYDLGSDLTVQNQTWTSTSISNSNIFFVVNAKAYTSSGTCFSCICVNRDTSSYVQILQTRSVNIKVRYIVLEYTKVTD